MSIVSSVHRLTLQATILIIGKANAFGLTLQLQYVPWWQKVRFSWHCCQASFEDRVGHMKVTDVAHQLECEAVGGTKRRVLLLGAPESQILDIADPAEIFARASQLLVGRKARIRYQLELTSTKGNSVSTTCGLRLFSHSDYASLRGPVDTLLVVGGRGIPATKKSPEVLRWLRRMAKRVRRLGSVCTGAFLLAEAGLLDNRRATTHWYWCREFSRRYPNVDLHPDAIFVRDGHVYTSAGVTAGMDLCPAMVEEDEGHDITVQVARELVLFLRRSGGQSQFSSLLDLDSSSVPSLRELRLWMLDHLREPLPVERLASRVAMSPRNFARVFVRELGTTPARLVQQMRLEAARRRLEESKESAVQVASKCGFGSLDSMRRAFEGHLGITPHTYRERFRTTAIM